MLPSITVRNIVLLASLAFCVASWGWRAFQWRKPLNVQFYCQRGLECVQQQDLAQAQLILDVLFDQRPRPAEVDLLEGAILLRSARLHDAIQKLKRAAEYPATRARANILAGEALYKNRQYGAAIDALKGALEEDATLVDGHRLLGATYYDLGATEPAIASLNRVISLAPNDPRPHRLIGIIHKDMESYEAAANDFQNFIDLSVKQTNKDIVLTETDRAAVLSDLAECLLKATKYEQLKKILPECPLTPRMLVVAARCELATGNPTSAQRLIDESLKIDPNYLEGLLLKANVQYDLSQVQLSLESLQQALKIAPLDYQVHHQLSQVYARLADSAQATTHANEANRLRDLRAKFTDLHARASIDSSNADLRYQLALTARELGLTELYVSWLQATLAIEPNHVAAKQHLDQFEIQASSSELSPSPNATPQEKSDSTGEDKNADT